MRLTDGESDSNLSHDLAPQPGSSSTAGPSNGHSGTLNGHGIPTNSQPPTNGSSSSASAGCDGSNSRAMMLPGTTLFEDSWVDREEFVRLVVQTLRDVGYAESAATLEAESGYRMETPVVFDFRQCVLNAAWDSADIALSGLITDDDDLREARFLLSQQKYLELLEASETTAALHVLRNELAPLEIDIDKLHSLSSLMMCPDAEELKLRAQWPGTGDTSRRTLLENLQRYIPPSTMIPQRRLPTLLDQARTYQRQQCLYHNVPSPFPSRSLHHPSSPSTTGRVWSLLKDHRCARAAFPALTTHILAAHEDEVWNIEWSHDGTLLASAGKDMAAIIWRIGPEIEPAVRECVPLLTLRDHPFPVCCLAWSLDDTILLTCADSIIKMWHAKSGVCMRDLTAHTETVTAVRWLPDGSGFVSGGMDRQIIFWDADGKARDIWDAAAVRVTDLAITPDGKRLVAVGMYQITAPILVPAPVSVHGQGETPNASTNTGGVGVGGVVTGPGLGTGLTAIDVYKMIIYDLATKTEEASIRIAGELTSVKISEDSRYALINQAPDEVQLWDLNRAQLARKYTGQRQGQYVIRSCFGGTDGNFIVSGSEDGKVYVWHRDTGALLEVLSGHGEGSVNSVSWNPREPRMFASCSDDSQIRIWEPPPAEMVSSECDESESGHTTHQHVHHHQQQQNGKGKGKSRERWDGGGGSGGDGSVQAVPTMSGL